MVGKEIFFIIHSFGDELLQQLHMELLRLCCVFHHLTYCFYCLISFHKFQLLRFLCPFLMMDFFSPLSYLIHRKYISEHKERWWWRKLFLCKKDFSDYNIFFLFWPKEMATKKCCNLLKKQSYLRKLFLKGLSWFCLYCLVCDSIISQKCWLILQ